MPFSQIAYHFVSRSTLIADNVRRQAQQAVPVNHLADAPDLGSGEGLARALFLDKNGDATARGRFDTTRQYYRDLASNDRDLDVVVEPFTSSDGPMLTITPVLSDGVVDFPLHLSGAGQTEAALLAALLAADVPILVLDEPATNLSTSAQRRVASAIEARRLRGQQTLVITHSSNLVPTEDLTSLLTLTRTPTGTVAGRVKPTAKALRRVRLLQYPAIRDALFASGVLLTEGESEAAALRVWLPDAHPTLEQSGVQLLDVRGDKSLVPHMEILDALRVPWAAVVDGPALRHTLASFIAPATVPVEFEAARTFWASHGVFTVADCFGVEEQAGRGELEAFFEHKPRPRRAGR